MVERVRITVGSGRVRVIGESRDGVTVDGGETSGSGTEMEVRAGSDNITVHVPTGTEVVIGSGSGDVVLAGSLGAVSVTTASGDVEAEEVASIDARTASGKLTVETSHGSVRLKTKSARVRVGRADGAVWIAAVSGQVKIGEAGDAVSIKTVSGNIEALITGRAPVNVEAISARIRIRVRDGVRPDVQLRTMSGKKRIECATGDDFVLTARTISGNITVTTE